MWLVEGRDGSFIVISVVRLVSARERGGEGEMEADRG